MNEKTPIRWTWFTTPKGTVGIVEARAEDGKTEFRIGPVDGFMEKMDVLQVVAWGARFPDAAGKALLGVMK